MKYTPEEIAKMTDEQINSIDVSSATVEENAKELLYLHKNIETLNQQVETIRARAEELVNFLHKRLSDVEEELEMSELQETDVVDPDDSVSM